MRQPVLALAALATLAAAAPSAPRADPAIVRAVANPARSAENRARDGYRHPVQTLAFFGVKPGQRIVEVYPSGGWYAEILARIPGPRGQYTGLAASAKGADAARRMLADKGLTGTIATVDGATGTSTVPAASQDVVLTFRNVHNMVMDRNPAAAANVFKSFYAMLKPGGTLGVVDHRLPEGRARADELKSGYLKRSTVVALATGAGFRLVGESEINANPKDDADHPEGVWTLPPTYQLKDVDRAKYAAIGESDRMTLRFVKPR